MNPPIPIPDPKVRHNQPLNLTQLGIIMIILAVGLVIGTAVFMIELIKKPKSKRAGELANGFELTEGHNIIRKSRVIDQNYSNLGSLNSRE